MQAGPDVPKRRQPRKRAGERRTKCAKPTTIAKARQAWELKAIGYTHAEIAAELGVGPSGIGELLAAYREQLGQVEGEGFRLQLLARLQEQARRLRGELECFDPKDRHRAEGLLLRNILAAAQLGGVIQQPPPAVVVIPPPRPIQSWPVEQLEKLRQLQVFAEQHDAPILAHGEAVDDGRGDQGKG